MIRTGAELKDLLTEHLDTMFSYALFITGRRDRALDLMQETVVSILSKKGPVYEEREAFRAWIFRILRNNWLNHVAKRTASREIPLADLRDEGTHPVEHGDPTPADRAGDPLLRDRLLAAFSELPPEQQEVCYCVDVEGLSYEETARRLAVPIGTVMSRLHRGREALKERLSRVAGELRIVPFSTEVRHGRRTIL